MPNHMDYRDTTLLFRPLGGVYDTAGSIAWAILRFVAGAGLVYHGYPKIMDPMGSTGMVESLGFHPGAVWSPLLAGTEFFGGILLALGLLTRPAAFATFVSLAVTIYFHWIFKGQGYEGAEKSILWSAICLFFAFNGGGRISLDRMLGREI